MKINEVLLYRDTATVYFSDDGIRESIEITEGRFQRLVDEIEAVVKKQRVHNANMERWARADEKRRSQRFWPVCDGCGQRTQPSGIVASKGSKLWCSECWRKR